MNVCCAADQCSVSSGEGYALHKFPTDSDLCKAWVRALKRKNFVPTKFSRLCDKHFTANSYIEDSDGFHILKRYAIPTIFDVPRQHEDHNSDATSIPCSVPGCKTNCLRKLENVVGKLKSIHLFKPPASERLFKKWEDAISGLTRSDHVCELHFQKDDIERFYVIKTDNGSTLKVEKRYPTLKKGSFPQKCLDVPDSELQNHLSVTSNPVNQNLISDNEYLSAVPESPTNLNNSDLIQEKDGCSVSKRLSVSPCSVDNSPKKCKIVSEDVIPKNTTYYNLENAIPENTTYGNSEDVISENTTYDNSEDIIFLEENQVSVNNCLTYEKVLKNLDLIKKPNNWWNIAPLDNVILFARWNENYTADKRIVIENNLTVRVFLKEWEINISDLMDITCIDDISALLEKVESYNINLPCS